MFSFKSLYVIFIGLVGKSIGDDPIDIALKPIKPIFDELGLKNEFPRLEESIKERIQQQENQTRNLQYHMKYFYEKVNSVYEMVKNPTNITPTMKKLTVKILEQVTPWFDQNNFDDQTLTTKFKLTEDEVEDYHEMYASSKILLRMIKRVLKKHNL